MEKSRRNPALIAAILDFPETRKWTSTDHKPYALVEIERNSDEFIEVQCCFQRSGRKRLIRKIERVENPFLLGQYLLNKEKLSEYMRSQSLVHSFDRFFSFESPIEYSYFHGTTRSCLDGICTNNFDWRKFGTSRGSKFGRGVSFTPMASYAMHYTKSNNVVFLVKVLKGESTVGNVLTRVPPEGFDTTDNGKGTVYVKYQDNEFYPEYIIYYY